MLDEASPKKIYVQKVQKSLYNIVIDEVLVQKLCR